jgi:hypothetical protein
VERASWSAQALGCAALARECSRIGGKRMAPRRPTGVSILAVLAIILGALELLTGLFALGGARSLAGTTGIATGAIVTMALFAIALGALNLAAGIGLWQLRTWAWMYAVLIQALSIVDAIVTVLFFRGSVSGELVSILVSALILYYLFRPEVQQAFNRTRQPLGM